MRTHLNLSGFVATLLLLGCATPALAQSAPSLGAAGAYAVLAGSTVTNTGSSLISGDVGVSPGTAITGFPPGLVVLGNLHPGDAEAANAQISLTSAYTTLASTACNVDLTGQDLGGLTLTPGVYCFSASASMTGTLTLNAQGNPNAVFIFKIGTTLITASGSRVVMTNNLSSCNIFWQVGSSATLGTGSSVNGNILAQASITLTTGASLTGRALAREGAVTLDTNGVSSACVSAAPAPCPAISLAPPTLPGGTVGVAYAQTISASGGTAPYRRAGWDADDGRQFHLHGPRCRRQ
jgi:hypothetical protein